MYNNNERDQKILFAQQQLNLLQQYGDYGYEVLQSLREKIWDVNDTVSEYWAGDFIFKYKDQTICRFLWQDADKIQITVFARIGNELIDFPQEYVKGIPVKWSGILASIRNFITEL